MYDDEFSSSSVPWYRRLKWYHHAGIGTVLVVVAAIVAVIFAVGDYSHEHTVTGTVCSAQAVASGSGGHTYMVYATSGVYDIKDHVVDGVRTTSANLFGEIQQYDTYRLTYYGWRNGVLSEFPNLLKVKLVSTNQKQGAAACAKSASG